MSNNLYKIKQVSFIQDSRYTFMYHCHTLGITYNSKFDLMWHEGQLIGRVKNLEEAREVAQKYINDLVMEFLEKHEE